MAFSNDPTLKPGGRNRVSWGAGELFASYIGAEHYDPRLRCPHCGCRAYKHRLEGRRPHFYRVATEAEVANPKVRIRHRREYEGLPLIKERVAEEIELETLYCARCAKAAGTKQVVCYTRKYAKGELIGAEA